MCKNQCGSHICNVMFFRDKCTSLFQLRGCTAVTTQFFTIGFFIVFKKKKNQSIEVQQNPVFFNFIADKLRLLGKGPNVSQ